jgi:hypothetical protein
MNQQDGPTTQSSQVEVRKGRLVFHLPPIDQDSAMFYPTCRCGGCTCVCTFSCCITPEQPKREGEHPSPTA